MAERSDGDDDDDDEKNVFSFYGNVLCKYRAITKRILYWIKLELQ